MEGTQVGIDEDQGNEGYEAVVAEDPAVQPAHFLVFEAFGPMTITCVSHMSLNF